MSLSSYHHNNISFSISDHLKPIKHTNIYLHAHHQHTTIINSSYMHPLILILVLFLKFNTFYPYVSARHVGGRNVTVLTSCPLDFSVLSKLGLGSKRPNFYDTTTQCQYTRQGLRLVLSEFFRVTDSFLPPLDSAESCWNSYEAVVDDFIPNFNIRRTCGFRTSWISSQGCMNITTRAQFESYVPRAVLDGVISACNHSLGSGSACSTCIPTLSNLQAAYLNGGSVGNVSDCAAYAFIYGAAVANSYGPTDAGTASCLFFLKFIPHKSKSNHKKIIICVVVSIFSVTLALGLIYLLYLRRKKKKRLRKKFESESTLAFSGLDSIRGNSTLIKYTFDEIKEATRNFSRENLIGRGGYGNVYKGVLPDGTEVALKRFKNLSSAGDADFAHEVEVIASVRHINLVALRGYCTATTEREGHQRIIVCDLMKNGSLYDHLFGSMEEKLSWPVRQKIALGMAIGLAYLHYGAQPAIIHRDIKASNILLDEWFEPKVADFGFAKFIPEGMTHLSTRVAGTMGYVAPEYALYGQLTERSDVYSFGVVLLELLSGKKALMEVDDEQPKLLADWAWSFVRKGRTLDVIEENMPDLGPPEVMEKYVMVAVLCSHPQLYARPTMDQIVKMLDTDVPVPSIPERPIPLIADIDHIEKSVGSGGSDHLSTISGYQPYTPRGDSENSID